MFWAYNLKQFFKLNIKIDVGLFCQIPNSNESALCAIKIDAGENIHKSEGKKNMLHVNKDRMIQILVYGTGVNKTFE